MLCGRILERRRIGYTVVCIVVGFLAVQVEMVECSARDKKIRYVESWKKCTWLFRYMKAGRRFRWTVVEE